VTHRLVPTVCAAALLALLPLSTLAQSRHWVQVEAHPTLRTAEQWAARYERNFGPVAGFRLPGGWYALALGPFETVEDAAGVRQRLLAERMIPQDAYLTRDRDYRAQFWPLGAQLPAVEVQDVPTAEAAPPPPDAADFGAAGESLAEARALDARLTHDERAEIQTALQYFGHYAMAIDAVFGPGTRRAIAAWQEAEGDAATGFLSASQRAALLGAHDAALARFGFETWRDETAGIEVTLPLGLVAFDRAESPFVHFREAGDSGIRVLLISQQGTQATLFGLYEIMQTLEAIPLEGERSRRSNGFVLTGESPTARAHAVADLQGGQIKGWALFWEPRADAAAIHTLAAMQGSFRSLPGVLTDNIGATPSAVARSDLLAGLEIRRPLRARSGFFVDALGTVATTAEAVQDCGRITIDSAYDADIRHVDAEVGVAILSPAEPLVPLGFAQFAPGGGRLTAEVRVSGYSYAELLTRPVLTFGKIVDLKGVNGETTLKRLAISVEEGDSGGPVFDAHGAVIGMLLPRSDEPARRLPDEVNFAVSADAMLEALEGAGLRGALSRENASMPPETLTRVSADLTVLVSCWP
jgi:peptidoglycan hydrolase-like protein with peptidoglycan-binding domain